MKIAIEQIYNKTKGEKSVLLLDQYSTHCGDFTKDDAKLRNILWRQ